jgi:hypothetical protein
MVIRKPNSKVYEEVPLWEAIAEINPGGEVRVLHFAGALAGTASKPLNTNFWIRLPSSTSDT